VTYHFSSEEEFQGWVTTFANPETFA